MPQLDENARAMLEAYADTVQPSTQSKRRNRARLLARIEAADDPPEAAVAQAQAPGDTRRWWPLLAVAAALAAAVALGWAARGPLTRTSVRPATQVEDSVRPARTTQEVDAAPTVPAAPRRTAPEPTTAVSAPPQRPERDPPASTGRPRPSASRRPAPEDAPDRLAAEVALLSQARAHVIAGKDAAALAAFERHRKVYPNGVLREERNAWIATLQCRLGRPQGPRSADAFLAAHPKSPHAQRVRTTCLGSVTDRESTEE